MASPADKRLLELLDKWLTSLELHTKYSALDDDSYWQVQPWIEHQRPSRWILDLAKQKTVALKSQVEERIEAGDAHFSESLELMIFLANLVGSEHIERFIPMAEMQNEQPSTPPDASTGTREMPKFIAAKRSAAPAAMNTQVARVERKTGQAAKVPARGTGRSSAKASPKAPPELEEASGAHARGTQAPAAAAQAAAAGGAREQVIADAVRLVQWGRKWFELPELVARMAGRPPLAEVRRILKENKSAIDEKAGKN